MISTEDYRNAIMTLGRCNTFNVITRCIEEMTKINALLLLEESEQQQGFLIFISLTIVNFLLTLQIALVAARACKCYVIT